MEPRGCNRWQPVANHARAKSAKTSHGKEGVDGSSPSEGFTNPLLTSPLVVC